MKTLKILAIITLTMFIICICRFSQAQINDTVKKPQITRITADTTSGVIMYVVTYQPVVATVSKGYLIKEVYSSGGKLINNERYFNSLGTAVKSEDVLLFKAKRK